MSSPLLIAFWLYIFALVIIWWFFFVARIHVLKYRNYNPAVVPVTKLLAFILLFLSCLGLFFVFTIPGDHSSVRLKTIQDATVSDGY